ncbi:DMT family transporter [Xinfangfangia sp. D13-10-4-6]|uniref:DMT family transporter n=1 Tax=Pseudogemmobacter hezensis TaxID=2737662 RepID=UPI001551EB18|nr:DMT family transporter [Pseudogemmobacter hezensis]NPD15862.1 DMT family transporter [Pseudogemmobacter hezensis]
MSATPIAASQSQDNRRATIMMIASMAAFAVEDTFLKVAAISMPPGQVLVINGLLGGGIFAILAMMRGEKVFSLDALRGKALVRNLSEGVAAFTYLLALAIVPMAMASALLQASPLMITAGAALFLGETVGWRRWISIVTGFVGVMIILKPWESGIDIAGLSMVGCVIALSVRDLVTRRLPPHLGTMSLSAWGVLASVPAGLLLMLYRGDGFETPAPDKALVLGCAVFVGLIGYYLVVEAMRIGEVSAVAPFRYTRLVFAFLLAIVFLGEELSLNVLLGSGLVILSGLYMFGRARKRAEKRMPTLPPGPT